MVITTTTETITTVITPASTTQYSIRKPARRMSDTLGCATRRNSFNHLSVGMRFIFFVLYVYLGSSIWEFFSTTFGRGHWIAQSETTKKRSLGSLSLSVSSHASICVYVNSTTSTVTLDHRAKRRGPKFGPATVSFSECLTATTHPKENGLFFFVFGSRSLLE